MIDSHDVALKWMHDNPGRAEALCDMLDSCQTLDERRELFASYTKEEKNGLMPELLRRKANHVAPSGSFVCLRNRPSAVIWVVDSEGRMRCVTGYKGSATVISQPIDGTYSRLVFLHEPWLDLNNHRHIFALVHAEELVVL